MLFNNTISTCEITAVIYWQESIWNRPHMNGAVEATGPHGAPIELYKVFRRVCVCVCAYVCICMCIYECMYVFVSVYVYVSVCV